MKPAPALRLAFAFAALLLLNPDGAAATTFTCHSTTTTKCRALAGYVAPNTTTYAAVKSLFDVKSIRDLLGANNLPSTTKPSQPILAGATVRVPFPCTCNSSDGRGASDGRPVYTVKPNDTLDVIARNIFSGFVTYQEIAAANEIKDPDLIQVKQKVKIPLPCSCDPVDGMDVVHYAHKTEKGSSVAAIAVEFGTTEATLLRINNMSDPKSLLEGQILDVPLRACNSSINATSPDRSLRVINGSYALTANGCVQCSCSADTWMLKCGTVTGQNTSTSCRAATCTGAGAGVSSGVLQLGQTVGTNCQANTCAYAGYNSSGTIFTTLVTNQSASCGGGGGVGSPPSGGHALGSSWWTAQLLVWFHVLLLCFVWL